jgi:SET domain-containing protein
MKNQIDMGELDPDTLEENVSLYKIQSIPDKGRGLIAKRTILPFTLLHVAPCIYFSNEEYEAHLRHTILSEYLFHTPGHGGYFLALGDGSLFNHNSEQPNVVYNIQVERREIHFSSSYRKIEPGEELCIHYGRDLWFKEGATTKKDYCHFPSQNGDEESNDGHSFLDQIDL